MIPALMNPASVHPRVVRQYTGIPPCNRVHVKSDPRYQPGRHRDRVIWNRRQTAPVPVNEASVPVVGAPPQQTGVPSYPR